MQIVWMFYFVYILEEHTADFDHCDDFNHKVVQGQSYLSGHYLEKDKSTKNGVVYRRNNKDIVFFFKESIIYPLVSFDENYKTKKNMYFLTNEKYCEILYFIETKMAALI